MKSERTERYSTPETGSEVWLLIGIGNSGRGDDGLGWAFLDRIRALYPDGIVTSPDGNDPVIIEMEYRYQLQVEDAELICRYRNVVFIDATEEAHEEGFAIRECESSGTYHFSSHIQGPESILYLSDVLFGRNPDALIVSISGYEWDLGSKMGGRAAENLEKAFNTFNDRHLIPAKSLEQINTGTSYRSALRNS